MSVVRFSKVVSALPDPMTPDTVYLMRIGAGFDIRVTDSTGAIAHEQNQSTGVASGGATGQLLAKVSAADFHTTWINAASGGGTSKWIDGDNPNDAAYLDGNVIVGGTATIYKFGVQAVNGRDSQVGIDRMPNNQATTGIYWENFSGNPNSAFKMGLNNSGVFQFLAPNNGIIFSASNAGILFTRMIVTQGGTLVFPSITLDVSSGNETGFYVPSPNTIGFVTQRTERARIDSDGNMGIGTTSPDTRLHVNGAITQNPLSADPPDPVAANSVQWVSDGTGSGDAGDVMMKINVGGSVKTVTLIDFSEVT